jgi:hypothetical protein
MTEAGSIPIWKSGRQEGPESIPAFQSSKFKIGHYPEAERLSRQGTARPTGTVAEFEPSHIGGSKWDEVGVALLALGIGH